MNMTYVDFEPKNPANVNRKCIDGKITGSNKCVGYCTYADHEGFLTDALRRRHDCINKECRYYIPKRRKKRSKKKNKGQAEQKVLEIVQDATVSYEGMKVIHAIKEAGNEWIFEYVSIVKDCPYEEIKKSIEKLLGVNIVMRRLDYDFDVCVKILLAS